MITFTLCLLALIVGYFTYGRLMERVFGPDDRKTPALTKADGVDYIPLPTWKIFMIQFLNIAGLGPIFGAIMGAKFGTSSYLWIVLGSIFAGAVHDYFAGMLSLRNGGESLPEIIGRYLGITTKQVMRGFTVILMILVGAVFVAGPAGLLAKLTPEHLDTTFWIVVVFAYYILATLLPVDKIIGKIYPLFAVALLFMAVGILVMLYINHPVLPELWDGLQNTNPEASKLPIFPIMFVSIACGAISGFHAGSNRRDTCHSGSDCSSDYVGRYGFPFGTSDCGGFLGNGTKKYASPFIHLYPDVCGSYRSAPVQFA